MEAQASVSVIVNEESAIVSSVVPYPSVDTSSDFGLSDEQIRELASPIPVAVLEPAILRRKAESFAAAFPGEVMYAVKCNPDPIFLRAMHAGGVHSFDVASMHEVKLIRKLFPMASVYFMHPIKAPEAIREAYYDYDVRAFVLDFDDELDKILEATDYAKDLELFVRIAVPKGNVATDFSTKFGAKPDFAANLAARCRQYAAKLGVSFHVGTQCTDPQVYYNAITYAAGVINDSGVKVEALDVGGGFPATLDDKNPPPSVNTFMKVIAQALTDNQLEGMHVLCEAGRGLVADAGSLVVRVEGRKGNLLYLNDGTYGGMFEAGGAIGLPYPVRLIRRDETGSDAPMEAFRFAGPTCDSVDMMNGPFMLPADIKVGDWIAINKLGAYGEVSRTNFNGFGKVQKIVIREERDAAEDQDTSAIMQMAS